MPKSPKSRLATALSGLTDAQIRVLLEIAEVLQRPITEQLSDSDIVTPAFAEDFRNRLLIHHATHDEKLSKRPFEFAFAASARSSGRLAAVGRSQTFAGADVTVDGVRYSLKTEASADIRPARVTISKLMEARWIRGCRTPEDFVAGVTSSILEHFKKYDRVLCLRAFDQPAHVRYELLEIPLEILQAAGDLEPAAFSSKTENGSTSANVHFRGKPAWKLRLDGSVEKVTVTSLDVRVCKLHATWTIPVAR